MPAWNPNDPAVVAAWQDVSKKYAQNASGTVHVVLGEDLRPGNVWESSEFDTLKSNPNVDQIVKIDPLTKTESVLWTR